MNSTPLPVFNYTAGTCSDLRADTGYLALTCILLCASISALVTQVFFSMLLWRSQAFHANVRLLLQNFSISGCCLSLHNIGRCCYNFILAADGFELGGVSTLRCEWIEMVFSASEASLTLSMAFVGIDRLISTIRQTHTDKERPTALAYAMVACCWAAGTIFHLISVLVSFQEDDKRQECYCQTMLVTPLSILYYMVAGFFFTEFSTAICFVILFRYSLSSFANFNISTAEHSLAERHQMMSNVKTSVLLCPSIILHGSVYAIISLTFVPLRILVADDNYISHISYALLILLIMEIEMVTQAVLLISRKDTLRKAAISHLPILERLFCSKAKADADTRNPGVRTNPRKVGPANGPNKANAQTAKNVAATGRLVDFRIKPEDNENILNALWASGPPAKGQDRAASKVPKPKDGQTSKK